jgi:exodeoxyribonuclease VII large subunit
MAAAERLRDHGRRAILVRARTLAHLSRAPERQVARHRHRLHQLLRELRASARRRGERGRSQADVHALVLRRTADRAQGSERVRRNRDLERLSLALAAHDPARTLARGYALVQDRDGVPLGSAGAARRARELSLRFNDGSVAARVAEEDDER